MALCEVRHKAHTLSPGCEVQQPRTFLMLSLLAKWSLRTTPFSYLVSRDDGRRTQLLRERPMYSRACCLLLNCPPISGARQPGVLNSSYRMISITDMCFQYDTHEQSQHCTHKTSLAYLVFSDDRRLSCPKRVELECPNALSADAPAAIQAHMAVLLSRILTKLSIKRSYVDSSGLGDEKLGSRSRWRSDTYYWTDGHSDRAAEDALGEPVGILSVPQF